jgi:hypothetical protein
MNKIMTTTIAACGFIAAVSAPLTAGAGTSVFSGQGPYVDSNGYDGDLSFQVSAFERATKNKSVKANSSGVSAYGDYFDGTYYYYFYGETTNIQLEATGKIPDKVIASGSIPGTWIPCDIDCHLDLAIPDTLVFNVNADAVIDQATNRYGTIHYVYPPYKVNDHFEDSSATAAFNSSSIKSIFGTVNLTFGWVGQSKFHDTERITN